MNPALKPEKSMLPHRSRSRRPGDRQPSADPLLLALTEQVDAACAGLAVQAPASRLRSLADLRAALHEVADEALRQAMRQARGEGWSLRRIAAHAGCSHEQVRQMLQDGPR
ncbi:hypothetical protein [Streptosporangium sandarakinum]|uniref:DNA-directed RNA polymerase specialized sigma24 family protein n=1 Tax=Streptosporangium sandarakinum TaxID=1260955 RepID=A0A852UTT5_9ACTN|nr:hypothetical protein [Streptosporangium sandarakinum]NYF38524.1 DNA-directed RNA polymerase specialized sigma24 family protein [Streptosporangium sandarakinum]